MFGSCGAAAASRASRSFRLGLLFLSLSVTFKYNYSAVQKPFRRGCGGVSREKGVALDGRGLPDQMEFTPGQV